MLNTKGWYYQAAYNGWQPNREISEWILLGKAGAQRFAPRVAAQK